MNHNSSMWKGADTVRLGSSALKTGLGMLLSAFLAQFPFFFAIVSQVFLKVQAVPCGCDSELHDR